METPLTSLLRYSCESRRVPRTFYLETFPNHRRSFSELEAVKLPMDSESLVWAIIVRNRPDLLLCTRDDNSFPVDKQFYDLEQQLSMLARGYLSRKGQNESVCTYIDAIATSGVAADLAELVVLSFSVKCPITVFSPDGTIYQQIGSAYQNVEPLYLIRDLYGSYTLLVSKETKLEQNRVDTDAENPFVKWEQINMRLLSSDILQLGPNDINTDNFKDTAPVFCLTGACQQPENVYKGLQAD